jgi:adenosylcobinamide-GDP ribazoletransferase
MKPFWGAIQFLTVIPLRLGNPPALGSCAPWFPIVGAMLGLLAASLLLLLRRALPGVLPELATLSALILLTGALHEDGLADCADAFRAGRPPERILAILKDSRIGAFGAIALIVSLLARLEALKQIETHLFESLVAALALSRAAQVWLAWTTPPRGEGLGRAFALSLTRRGVYLTLLWAALIACALGVWIAPALTGSAGLLLLARSYFVERLGGVTGDCLGAIHQIVEIYVLVLCASIW